jgi:hypothetical protein
MTHLNLASAIGFARNETQVESPIAKVDLPKYWQLTKRVVG